MSDDFELLAAWGQGDSQAGDTLARRHYHGVLRFFDVRAAAHGPSRVHVIES